MTLQSYFNNKKLRLAATLNSLISTISQLSVACQLQIDQQYLTAKSLFSKYAMKQNENLCNTNSNTNSNMNIYLQVNRNKMNSIVNNLGSKQNPRMGQDQIGDEYVRQYCEELRKQEAHVLTNIIKHLLQYFKAVYLTDSNTSSTQSSSNLQAQPRSLDIKPVTHNQKYKQRQKQTIQTKKTAEKQINKKQWIVIQETPPKQFVFVGQGTSTGREGAIIETVRKNNNDGYKERDKQGCNGSQMVQQVNKGQTKHKQNRFQDSVDPTNKRQRSYIQLMPKKRYQSLTKLAPQSPQRTNQKSPINHNLQAQPQPQLQSYPAQPQPQSQLQPQQIAPQSQPMTPTSALQQIPKTCQKLDNMIHEEAVELLRREKDRDRNRARVRNQYNAKKFYQSLDKSRKQGDSAEVSRGNSRLNTLNSVTINQKADLLKNNIVNINKINKTNPNSIVLLSNNSQVDKSQNRTPNSMQNPNQLIKQCLSEKQKLYRTSQAPSNPQPQLQASIPPAHLHPHSQFQNPKSISVPMPVTNYNSYQGYGNIDKFNQPIFINSNNVSAQNYRHVQMVQFQGRDRGVGGNVLRSRQRSQRMLVSQEKIRDIQRHRDRDKQNNAYLNR